MKIFRSLLTVLVGLLSQMVNAQSANTSSSLLWKVSGLELREPSYLFGTIHMICAEDYFFNDAMQDAMNKTKTLVLEIDLSDPVTLMQYQQLMLLPEGATLRDFFSDETSYTQFKTDAEKLLGMELSSLGRLKPLMLISLLSSKNFACATQQSYEMNLIQKAKQKDMSIKGLESVEAQMAIFDTMTKQDIQAMLMQTIEELKSGSQQTNEMIQLYKKQNIEGLHNLIAKSPDIRGHENDLLYNRNQEWVSALPQIMKASSSFIAVGAGHLGGQDGVINLLRKKGYRVEPVF